MPQTTDFIKVRTFLILKEGDKVSVNDNGTFNASDDFKNRINEYDEMFRSKIMTFINDAIGLHNWAVKFGQFTPDDSIYDVIMYADKEENAMKIKSIISEKITDRDLRFYYKGTMEDYLKMP